MQESVSTEPMHRHYKSKSAQCWVRISLNNAVFFGLQKFNLKPFMTSLGLVAHMQTLLGNTFSPMSA